MSRCVRWATSKRALRATCARSRARSWARSTARRPQANELRRSQNWIGGTRPGNAAFVPPPPQQVADLLTDDVPSVLVGHSLGGMVALGAALRRPAAVRGLVLLGSGARIVVTPFLQRLASERFHELVGFQGVWDFEKKYVE